VRTRGWYAAVQRRALLVKKLNRCSTHTPVLCTCAQVGAPCTCNPRAAKHGTDGLFWALAGRRSDRVES
jgi:hypothetical protein